MKRFILLFSVFFIVLSGTNAQDTLYMYKSGMLIMKQAVTEIDSITFKPADPSAIVIDIDGNIYNTVQIGTQTWMAGNLRTSRYNDGTPIANITDNTEWNNLTSGAYSWYDNDSTSYEIPYGKLYNWHTVNTGKLCPAGWHVANEDEWLALRDFLGGSSAAGGKLKATGTIENGDGLWIAPNTGATNSTGFNGLPGGRRYGDGSFEQKGIRGSWWSSLDTPGFAFFWSLSNSSGSLNGASQSFNNGMSVRCIKD